MTDGVDYVQRARVSFLRRLWQLNIAARVEYLDQIRFDVGELACRFLLGFDPKNMS